MKKQLCFLVIMTFVVVTFCMANRQTSNSVIDMCLVQIESLAADETDNGYSCTASSNCYGVSGVNGSVSCTGQTCRRGAGWVECDGKKTKC